MKVPLFKIYNDSDMVAAMAGVCRRGTQWCEGPTVKEFEAALAQYIGVKYAVCVNSGTSALHLALLAGGIGPGDEVIVPSFTFIATANAVLMVGAKPVFADIEEQTFGLDPLDFASKITRKTKAVIPVHYGGYPCQIEDINAVARAAGIRVIEDAAEALGAPVGTYGDASILSFCQNKMIATGEGGAVVTNSEDIANRVMMLRSHGRTEGYFEGKQTDYITLGYNFRMSDITAALGLSQLKKIDDLLNARLVAASKYRVHLWKVAPLYPAIVTDSVYQLYTIRFESQAQRDKVKSHLTENGIGCKVYFEPVHKTHFYQSMRQQCDLPVTEKVSSEVLSLPIWPGISQEEIEYVCEKVKECL